MEKTFTITDLDCAHCASKMESEIQKLAGVRYASINFMTQKLQLETDDAQFEEILAQIREIITRIEPDCELEG